MVEILINDNTTILSDFKVERVYEWNDVTRKSELVHKTFISMSDISKTKADEIKKYLQGDSPSKGFGRFDFEGDVSFNINNFYITLYNISLSDWKYEVRHNRLKINFKPLNGFGYLSGMGLNVLRDQKLNQILNF